MSTSTPDYNRFAGVYDASPKKKKKQGCNPFYVLGIGCLGCIGAWVTLCAIVGVGAWAVGRAEAADTSVETYSVAQTAETVHLDVDLENGGVEVIGQTDTDDIRVEITRKVRSISEARARAELDNFDVNIDDQIETDGTLTIRTDYRWGSFNLIPSSRSVDLRIMLPENINITLKGSNGRMSLADVNLSEDVSIETSNGGIDIHNVSVGQNLTVETSNGGIDVEGLSIGGELQIKTSNGQLDLKDIDVEQGGSFTTSNGQINFEGTIGGNSDTSYVFETNNGQVILDFAEDSRFRIDASVDNGSLNNGLKLIDSQSGRSSTQGCYNSGQPSSEDCDSFPSVVVRTDNGAIRLGAK